MAANTTPDGLAKPALLTGLRISLKPTAMNLEISPTSTVLHSDIKQQLISYQMTTLFISFIV